MFFLLPKLFTGIGLGVMIAIIWSLSLLRALLKGWKVSGNLDSGSS